MLCCGDFKPFLLCFYCVEKVCFYLFTNPGKISLANKGHMILIRSNLHVKPIQRTKPTQCVYKGEFDWDSYHLLANYTS